MRIGRTHYDIEEFYYQALKNYVKELKQGKNTKDLVNGLLVAYSVDQMGYSLLEISESILSNNFGQPINTERYFTLQQSLGKKLQVKEYSELEISKVADTRSGSGINAISKGEDDVLAILKDGLKKKLKKEKDGVESWHRVFPGLAPQIINYHKNGEWASLLIEHLNGLTFEQIILHNSEKLRKQSLNQLFQTLLRIWGETRSNKAVSANHMLQLEKRLSDVAAVHPDLITPESHICGLQLDSLPVLCERAITFEEELKVPFSVYIHGDFNIDNVIYDTAEGQIKYIDLHRSTYTDYTQDIAVFMVSNYRLQIFDSPVRKRIFRQINDVCHFARRFAAKEKDKHFELRLGLGLARSLITSTRFIRDKGVAQGMVLRAQYLLEKILKEGSQKKNRFQVPVEEIFYA